MKIFAHDPDLVVISVSQMNGLKKAKIDFNTT